MPRYLMRIEYDGRNYRGWQRQDNGPSVQARIEDAIRGFSQEDVTVFCAGRTDAGVHATGQCAHIDLTREWQAERVKLATNAALRGSGIAILEVRRVDDTFHARFDAIMRYYLYRMSNRRAPPALRSGQVWHHPWPLNVEAMHEASQLLLGTHDFTSFRASQCQAKSPVKTLSGCSVLRDGDEVHFRFHARSFLHNQVRAMTGSLTLVGRGKWPVSKMRAVLQAQDRTKAGPNAPPDGLYLEKVVYGSSSG